ncbi:molybdopterin converting factor [bacterium]|nr:molybdopterin converting factor [bacterium]
MRLLFINNDGGGFADEIDVTDGLTVRQLFEQRLPQGQPGDYLIRVNRQPTTGDTVLQPGDRVTITPLKIEGAEAG